MIDYREAVKAAKRKHSYEASGYFREKERLDLMREQNRIGQTLGESPAFSDDEMEAQLEIVNKCRREAEEKISAKGAHSSRAIVPESKT